MQMTNLVEPIHQEEIFDGRIRYFASPVYLKTHQPDMPWHVFDDLLKLLSIDQEACTHLLRKLRGDWPEPITVATSQGLLTIAPHFMADGMLEAIGRSRKFRPENFLKIRGAYRRNLTAAVHKMLPHYGPIERMYFVLNCVNE